MSCEGACAHAHVRCAVARVRVRAKSILKSVRDVRACGSFSGVRCATALLHTFRNKIARKMLLFVLKTILEHSIPFYNISFCSRTLKMLKNCWKKIKKLLKNVEQLFKSAGAKCDHLKLKVRTCVRAHLNLDVRGECMGPKKRSQPMP